MLDLTDRSGAPRSWNDGERWWRGLTTATAHLSAPVAVIDRDALAFNAADLVRRAGGVPIRVASKSIRVRGVLDAVLRMPGYRGILAFTLAEALWLAEDHDDIVLGYPSVDIPAIERLLTDDHARARVTLMVDDEAQLDLVDRVAAPAHRGTVRVAIDADASWRAPRPLGHIGVRRSPLHTVQEVRGFAERVIARPGFELVGLMMYEAQVAGQGDATGRGDTAVRWMQRRSVAELTERRAAIVEAVSGIAPISFVNGGGTGSLEATRADLSVTELTAGSGLLAGHLFDAYRAFDPAPASAFALDVVRRPSPDIATVLGGGWIASGPADESRQPLVAWPPGLKRLAREGSGEVQTPLEGRAARRLRIGDRVWFRHAKSGEASERVDRFHVVDAGVVADTLVTYRGEGKAFL